jgi:hypothetical protein
MSMSGNRMTTPHGFPTGDRYQEAVQHPDRCFSDPDLRAASFERMAMGLPKVISGNFASVFPMTAISGHRYAVKCFTREVPNQLQRYMIISGQLKKMNPWWATEFQFISAGIQVDQERYPILRMNWVNGVTLTRWITKNINRDGALSGLAVQFDQLISDLTAEKMAHGDLQDGNLLVTDSGGLHLVDYDGMFVPGLEGLPADELGHPNYQPPGRSQADYGPTMDRYSAWLIALSLRMLAVDPGLWDQLNPLHEDYLLLTRSDLVNLAASQRFARLTSHRNAEVRRLAHIARDILPLPLAAMPALAVPSPTIKATQSVPRMAAAGGIPDWMRSHVPEPAGSSGESDIPSPTSQIGPRRSNPPSRSLKWFVRTLAMLPLAAAVGAIWNWRIGLAGIAAAAVLITTIVWTLYRRDPLTRKLTQLRQARARAASGVRQAAAEVARISKNRGDAERAAQRLDDQQAKKRIKIQADFDRRLQRVAHPQEAVDKKLAQLSNRKQQEINRRLIRLQQEHVRSWLSRMTIDSNQVPGVGAQLVAKLGSVGIRVAGDFSGIASSYRSGAPTVYFRLASGRLVHVPGIGAVKAQRLEQWRQSQVAHAVRRQPSALPTSDLRAIDVDFAAQEKQLKDERAHLTQQMAAQSAAIKRELNAALVAAATQHQTEQIPIEQRKTELTALLSQAHSSHLTAQQQLLDQDNRLAAAGRPAFKQFVGAVLRG